MCYQNTWCWVRASPIFLKQYMLRKRDLVAEVLVLQTSEGYFYYDNVSALIRNTGCDQLLAKKNGQNSKANVCINDLNKLTSRELFRQSNRLSEVA